MCGLLLVGNHLGNYILANNQAVGKIYEYVAPISGIPQGNYKPIVRLIAPTENSNSNCFRKIQSE